MVHKHQNYIQCHYGLCLVFYFIGHIINYQLWPISYLHKKFEHNRSINAKVTFEGRYDLCLATDCTGYVSNHQLRPISYLHTKFEQNRSINAKVTFLGCCGLCLAFDCNGYVTRLSQWAITYLDAKLVHKHQSYLKRPLQPLFGLWLQRPCSNPFMWSNKLPACKVWS